MSSYYPSFSYMGINSLKDKNLIVASFDADQGEMDTFLEMESIYTDNSDGSKRLDYGAKYSSVATVKISVIKDNQNDFTVAEVRDFLRWTTGVRKNSYLDLLIGDEIKYSFLGRVTNAYQQKLDARTIGLAIEFTSASPWAYSPQQNIQCEFGHQLLIDKNGFVSKNNDPSLLNVTNNGILYNGTSGGAGLFKVTDDGVAYIDGSVKLRIDNQSDDLYSYITLDTKFINKTSDNISIKNLTLNEDTIITGVKKGEIITLSSGQFIASDDPHRIFGNNFNFIWPRLAPGVNDIVINGDGIGSVQFSYRYPIKIGDCAIDVDIAGNDISCDNYFDGINNGCITTTKISWENIENTPTTLVGYGITDAYPITAVYNKNEIDDKLEEINTTVESTASLISDVSSDLEDNYYDKSYINNSYYNKTEIDDIVYTEEEINNRIDSLDFDIKSNTSLISNISSDLENNYYNKTDIETHYYDTNEIDVLIYQKKQIDKIVDNLVFDIKSNAYLISSISSELTNNYYDNNYIDDNYYDKTDIDNIISAIKHGSHDGSVGSVLWSEILNKPTTLSGYRVKEEVQSMIDEAKFEVVIDEEELNAMLASVLV